MRNREIAKILDIEIPGMGYVGTIVGNVSSILIKTGAAVLSDKLAESANKLAETVKEKTKPIAIDVSKELAQLDAVIKKFEESNKKED